ncbi:NADP-dependent oxidoreductase [Archangium lipolyticum]|uniref:NADP-dependent oxidoreductase n=1 Tax=Archangium lipolyticum TaxID=2970465 RepID=UPI002149D492|nr:NADP-dependent oxidoreductase [Archangium lipolyticum]
MKAARIHGHGDLGNVVIEDIPTPEFGPDEVLIRVEAASLNPLDLLLLGGKRREVFPLSFPYTLGIDLAGTVEGAGPLAARWRKGDRVIARPDPVRGGAFARYAVVPATHVAAAPAHLSLNEAAGLPTAAGTAWQALFETARLTRGQTVLIHAGAGGVGSFAVQLARLAGARTIATASGPQVELVRRLGADEVLDYRTEDFSTTLSGVDVVLDTVGGETQQRSFPVLRAGGVLVSITTPPDEALAKAHAVSASRMSHKTDATRLGLLSGLCDAGSLQVLVDRKHPLEELELALRHQASGRAHGKIILKPD